jgi:2'-5' RNA ligase
MIAGAPKDGAAVGLGQAEAATLRAFVAVPLPEPLRVDLSAFARRLAPALPTVRWTRKVENLHVTVRFLGQVAAPRLDALTLALAEELAPRPAFSATVRGLGAFPDERHATTLWAGIDDPDGHLREVGAAVERVTDRLGFVSEGRSFRAHVTVGRCKRAIDARPALEPWRAQVFGAFTVTALHVYESRLGGAGSTYVLRGRAPFGAPRAA